MANPRIFRIFANGIRDVGDGRFFPFHTNTFSPGTILPRKQNVRYFIKSLMISYTALGTDAGSVITVTGTVDKLLKTLVQINKTTLVVGTDMLQEWNPLALLDIEGEVDFLAADITAATITITWAEVDAIE